MLLPQDHSTPSQPRAQELVALVLAPTFQPLIRADPIFPEFDPIFDSYHDLTARHHSEPEHPMTEHAPSLLPVLLAVPHPLYILAHLVQATFVSLNTDDLFTKGL